MSIHVYAEGPAMSSVCAPKEMSPEQVAAEVNLVCPTGITSQWRISSDKHFASGHPMPCVCAGDSTRMHWLMEC